MNWYGNELQTTVLDSEITKAMTDADADALTRAQELGILKDKSGTAASDILARYIVQGARRGKYNPKILAEGAIKYLLDD